LFAHYHVPSVDLLRVVLKNTIFQSLLKPLGAKNILNTTNTELSVNIRLGVRVRVRVSRVLSNKFTLQKKNTTFALWQNLKALWNGGEFVLTA
jgi:hypothetical protein